MSNERLKSWLDQLEAEEQAKAKPPVMDEQEARRRIVNLVMFTLNMNTHSPLTDILDFSRSAVEYEDYGSTIRVFIPADFQAIKKAEIRDFRAIATITGDNAKAVLDWAQDPNVSSFSRPLIYTLTYTAYAIYDSSGKLQKHIEHSEAEAAEFALNLRLARRAWGKE